MLVEIVTKLRFPLSLLSFVKKQSVPLMTKDVGLCIVIASCRKDFICHDSG